MESGLIFGGVADQSHHLRSLLADMAESAGSHASKEVERPLCFNIRAADCSGTRSSASILIDKMYAKRGYLSSPLSAEKTPNRLTLVASDHHSAIGTLTVGFDDGDGLLVEDLFPEEVRKLRDDGCTVCEFTKLAMDNVVRSKRVLAALFNVAYLYAYKIRGADCLLIEVNPRHVRYYRNMLGFKVIGATRLNTRVNAPAVLLSLDLAYVNEKVIELGGRPELAATNRSIYPHFFCSREESRIISRLRGADAGNSHIYRTESHVSGYSSAGMKPTYSDLPMHSANIQGLQAATSLRAA